MPYAGRRAVLYGRHGDMLAVTGRALVLRQPGRRWFAPGNILLECTVEQRKVRPTALERVASALSMCTH